ncbi:MAG: hypothetical protein ACP5H2_04575 [Solirubrobacteraceae bacterium]
MVDPLDALPPIPSGSATPAALARVRRVERSDRRSFRRDGEPADHETQDGPDGDLSDPPQDDDDQGFAHDASEHIPADTVTLSGVSEPEDGVWDPARDGERRRPQSSSAQPQEEPGPHIDIIA